MRNTSIITTIGRLYNSEEYLGNFIKSGADVLRTNLAHQNHAWHRDLIARMKKVIAESGREIRIEADISGSKVRTGNNPEGQYFINISQGQEVVLSTSGQEDGKVYLPFPTIHEMVEQGSRINIDDASVQLEVKSKQGSNIVCQSLLDCRLGGNRTVVVPGKDFGLPTITEKDWDDLEFIATQDVDYLGFSMVKNDSEVRELREFFKERGSSTKITSKIETPQAVSGFDRIMRASDAIMVARGDMGVSLPLEKVPFIQYDIIKKCNSAGKFVIVATEMLNSMKSSPNPTRAEVNDIYTAVSSGANAVMLSGETTEGKYPLRSLEFMRKVVEEAESRPIMMKDLSPAFGLPDKGPDTL